MERNNWNNRNRYSNDRNQNSGNEGRADEDSYRGAYRLDNTSDHRNVSTWNGFDRGESNRNQSTDYNRNYNNDYNRNYNNDYNRNYTSGQQGGRGSTSRDNEHDSRNHYQGESDSNRSWDAQRQSGDRNYSSGFNRDDSQRSHDSVRSRIDRGSSGWNNFNTDYSPDNYGSRRDANYGNTAGSLSYGYDGGRNSDPDWNRQYDPLSGERRSYHGNYQSRQPERGQYRDATSRNRNGDNDNDWF